MKGEGHNLGVDNVVVSGYKTMLVGPGLAYHSGARHTVISRDSGLYFQGTFEAMWTKCKVQ